MNPWCPLLAAVIAIAGVAACSPGHAELANSGPLASDAASPAEVLAAFKAQGNASLVGSALRTERPRILLRAITELHPTAPGVGPHIPYTGWVVIYRQVRVVSYGPPTLPKNTRGTFVAILDAAGQWTGPFRSNPLVRRPFATRRFGHCVRAIIAPGVPVPEH